MTTNPELELAFEYISQTGRNIFLTGKAGTGKTTFLHRIRNEVAKRIAVVAPTGVAAINAKGMTIHSFFQLPFGNLTPDFAREQIAQRGYTSEKIRLYKSLDLLVIDEVSMVRADVLDAINIVLQRFRRSDQPFGGLQLLMIGDLHQLPPVVKPDDWATLQPYYTTPYFFGSRALQAATPTVIQLQHIYRQSDETFISLLNKVRNNQMDDAVLEQLNSRYQAAVNPAETAGYITLSSHNHTANSINKNRLEALAGKEYRFKASVSGDFPESMYPNDPELHFKLGAQVMFNKNDGFPNRLYYNGKIGEITAIKGDAIFVQCPDEPPVEVFPIEWQNRKFTLNPDTKQIEESIIGTYTQHPLKLAWAITIHKSQGLTFDRVMIDAQSAFAHGQVYVALSRCKSFEGVRLLSPIGNTAVRTDAVVSQFTAAAEQNPPDEAALLADKQQFQANCLRELFNFNWIEREARRLQREIIENQSSLQSQSLPMGELLLKNIQEKLQQIGSRFLPQLEIYCREPQLPASHPLLLTRLKGAAAYFIPQLKEEVLPFLRQFPVLTDNKELRKRIGKHLEELQLMLFTKQRLFEVLQHGFDPLAFIKAQADAELDFKEQHDKKQTTTTFSASHLAHPELYRLLKAWRKSLAEEHNVAEANIFTLRTLEKICDRLPRDKKELVAIHGFGATSYKRFGQQLLEAIRHYLGESTGSAAAAVAPHQSTKAAIAPTFNFEPAATKPPNTKAVSLHLFQQGKTLEEIATERGFVVSTIFTHLAHWVLEGTLAPTDLIPKKKLDTIWQFFKEQPDSTLMAAQQHLGQEYDYNSLRLVMRLLEKEGLQ